MDSDEVRLMIAVGSDLLIATGYLMLGALVVGKFDTAAPTWALRIFRLSGLVFFVLCAATHVHQAGHAFYRMEPDPTSGHALGIHVVQGIAAVVASVIGWTFVSLRIYDRTEYLGLLDREIDRQARAIAARVRERDVDHLASEARRVADAAELISSALRSGRCRDA